MTDTYPGAAKGDMLPSFIAHILDGTPPDVTTGDVLGAMAVSLAIEQSLVSGKPERVRTIHKEDERHERHRSISAGR